MRLNKLSALLLSLALAACGGSSKGSPQPAKPAPAAGDSMCPVEVPGTAVTVEDTATGAAFVFVTTGDVGELRRRVAAMAKMHNEHHASMGAMPDGTGSGGGGMAGHEGHDMGGGGMAGHEGHDMGGGGGMAGHEGHDMGGMGGGGMAGHGGHGGMMIMMHSKATATDVQGGARLEFTVDPANVAKLQGEMRMHAQHMSAGTCAMPGGSTGGAMPNAPAPAQTTPADPHAGHH